MMVEITNVIMKNAQFDINNVKDKSDNVVDKNDNKTYIESKVEN